MPKKQRVALPIDLSSLPPEEVAKPMAEDVKVEKILRDARGPPAAPMVSEKSIRDGERFMAKMRRASEAALLSRIERGELIAKDELVTRLGGNRRWISDALKAGRLFSLQAPSGVDYFPSFFADSSYGRRAVGRVVFIRLRTFPNFFSAQLVGREPDMTCSGKKNRSPQFCH